LTSTRNTLRSRLSLKERELEHKDNLFIIHPNSIHNYKKITVRSYQVRSSRVLGHLVSGHFGFRGVSYRVLGHLVLGRFGFRVGSYQVGSGIGSFRVLNHIRSGRVLSHLMLGHFGFQVILGRVGSGIESFSVGLFRILNRIGSERVGRVSRVGSGSATSIRIIILKCGRMAAYAVRLCLCGAIPHA
jgi:hypothetical protein